MRRLYSVAVWQPAPAVNGRKRGLALPYPFHRSRRGVVDAADGGSGIRSAGRAYGLRCFFYSAKKGWDDRK